MTSFVLKIIAIICMVIDHVGDAFIGHISFFNIIGRIAFPIFAFLITEGYLHTSNKKKYAIRLFLFSLISQIPFTLFLHTFTNTFALNIFFTLLSGLLAIWFYDTRKSKIVGFIGVLCICLLAQVLCFDYGFYGVFIIFIFFITKDFEALSILLFAIATTFYYLPAIIQSNFYPLYYALIAFTLLPVFLFHFYHGKQGKKLSYFFYVFYPAHLLLIWLIKFFFLT